MGNHLYAHNSILGLVEIPWRGQDLINEACQRFSNFESDVIEMASEDGALASSLCTSAAIQH